MEIRRHRPGIEYPRWWEMDYKVTVGDRETNFVFMMESPNKPGSGATIILYNGKGETFGHFRKIKMKNAPVNMND